MASSIVRVRPWDCVLQLIPKGLIRSSRRSRRSNFALSVPPGAMGSWCHASRQKRFAWRQSTFIFKALQCFIGISSVCLCLCFLLRGSLLTAWYARHGGLCRNNVSQQPIMHRSFIGVIYSLCTIVRALQYPLLAKGFITFVSNVQSDSYMKSVWRTMKYCCTKEFKLCRTMKRWCYIGILILLALSLGILSVAVPVIGIFMELNHNHKHCEDHDKVIFIVYCVFDIFSCLSESCVRLLMIFAAIEINRIWSHASASLKKVHTDETDIGSTNQSFGASSNTHLALSHQCTNPIFEDWTASSNTHQALSRQYEESGKQAQQVGEIFKTWFILPWIAFLISNYVKAELVLSPWVQGDEEKDLGVQHWLATFYYMVYAILQVILILVQYVTALKMNTDHGEYYGKLREKQLNAHKSNNRRVMACMMAIKKNEQYDFVPHLPVISINVPLNNAFYVITTLLGMFFPIVYALFVGKEL